MFLQRIAGEQVGVDLRQLDEQANQWLSGSDLEQSLLRFDESLRHLTAIAPEKLAEMGTSEAEIREDTFSRVAKGPPGFQAAQVLRSRLDEALDNWGRVQGTLDHASKTADTLKRWATDASVIESDMDYLIEAIETYRITFPNSKVRIDPMEMDDGAAIFGLATGSAIAGTVFALSLAGALLAG